MASWGFFTCCFVNCILFFLLRHLSWSSSLWPPENLHRVSLKKNHDRSSRLVPQDSLSQFLSTLNLTGQTGQRDAQALASIKPPEYMLELYERFTEDHTAAPSANIVRSFKNEDASPYRETPGGVRTHRLLFNISMPRHEHVTLAELHFFNQIQQVRRAPQGPGSIVTVYHVQEGVGWSRGVQRHTRSSAKEEVLEINDLEELVTKHINTIDNGWLSFDLTAAVTHWLKSGSTNHRMEVHITNLGRKRKNTSGKGIDFDPNGTGKHHAAMIVFSEHLVVDPIRDKDKLSSRMEQQHPLKYKSGPVVQGPKHKTDQVNQGEQQVQLNTNFISDTPSRFRRSVKSDACKRTPLFVDFKDIGWDTWIIQPLGYEAYECKGECYPPLTSEVTPTRHAMVQTLLSLKSPDRVSRACCVPTKLEPISLLYHENGVVTFNHKYEGMVVAECGCR